MPTHVITGAGSGIGAAVARRLLDRGDSLVLCARDEDRARELATEFSGATTVVTDLSDPESLESTLSAGSLPEGVDSLIHVAGVVDLSPVAETPVSRWMQQLTVNLVAPAELTRILLPALRSARGRIVFVNSGVGLRSFANWSVYGASKHGLRALADAVRQEERANGVRVTSVFPGGTATPMQVTVQKLQGNEFDAAKFIDPESVASSILHVLDLPRDADVTDLTVSPGN